MDDISGYLNYILIWDVGVCFVRVHAAPVRLSLYFIQILLIFNAFYNCFGFLVYVIAYMPLQANIIF